VAAVGRHRNRRYALLATVPDLQTSFITLALIWLMLL
jgi:hypothetical protein